MSAVAVAASQRSLFDEPAADAPAAAPRAHLSVVPAAAPAPAPNAAAVPARPFVTTLADAVGARWRDLTTGVSAACLLCGGTMEPRPTAGHGIAGGRCRDCGTTLD